MSLTDRQRLAVNLKVAREAAGIAQAAAGEAVGKVRGTIVNWENPAASAEPNSDEVATLAALYGVSSQDLRFAVLIRRAAAPRTHAEVLAMTGLADEKVRERPAKAAQTRAATPKSGRTRRAGGKS